MFVCGSTIENFRIRKEETLKNIFQNSESIDKIKKVFRGNTKFKLDYINTKSNTIFLSMTKKYYSLFEENKIRQDEVINNIKNILYNISDDFRDLQPAISIYEGNKIFINF